VSEKDEKLALRRSFSEMKQGSIAAFFTPLSGRKPPATPSPVAAAPKKDSEKKAPKPEAPADKGEARKKQKTDENEREVEEVATPKPKPKAPAAAKKKAPAARKRKKDDDDDEVELFDDEDDEEDEEEEGEEEEEEQQLDEEQSRVSVPAAAGKQSAAFARLPEARELAPDKAFLSQLVPGVSFDQVKPRATNEPVFQSDLKQHNAFVKKLRLQDQAAEPDSGPSADSPMASIVKRPGVKYTPLELQFLAVKEKHPDVVLFIECGYKV
jgi:hypothetical protein